MALVQEYWLPLRLTGALVLAVVLGYLLIKWLKWCPWQQWLAKIHLPFAIRYAGRIIFLWAVYIAALLGVFGGSLGWQTAVDWENAGVTKDDFLNEAILDNP